MSRQIVGYIGPRPDRLQRKFWNELFRCEQRDAFFDFYRCSTSDLPLRLSEMFVLQRRGYIVDESFQRAICDFVDIVAPSAQKADRVDTIINEEGILRGEYLGGKEELMSARYEQWFAVPAPHELIANLLAREGQTSL